MCLSVTNLKTLWLLNIYFLLNNSIEKGSLHIHLMKRQPISAAKEITVLIDVYLATGEKVSS
jgi:hypothetical protein